MGNSKSPLPAGYEYFKSLINAKAEKLRLERQANAKLPDDPEVRARASYGSWMAMRSATSYAWAWILQSVNVHELTFGLAMTHSICSCGLIYPITPEREDLRYEKGHIFHLELTTVFICDFPVESDVAGKTERALYCQVCDESWPVIYKPGSDGSAGKHQLENIDLVATMAQHEQH